MSGEISQVSSAALREPGAPGQRPNPNVAVAPEIAQTSLGLALNVTGRPEVALATSVTGVPALGLFPEWKTGVRLEDVSLDDLLAKCVNARKFQ